MATNTHKLNTLKQRNSSLKKEQATLVQKIKMYQFLKWVKDDIRIKRIRRELDSIPHSIHHNNK